ncbi:MAG: hypothetical protein JNL38_29630, partial [Myxococcales bacterium]|nr:hypothetical protein [Myxococcales bacterium]
WGDDWGERGYCYLPKKVIADSEPELVAILFQRPGAAGPPPGGPHPGAAAPAAGGGGPRVAAPASPPVPVQSARASVTCFACGASTPAGKACASCGQPLMARRFCDQCGGPLPQGAAFCEHCGARVPR